MLYIVLILSSFAAACISGAAGFGGALLLLPVVTLCVGAETAVPILTIAQLLGNLSRIAFGIKQIDWKSVGLFARRAAPGGAWSLWILHTPEGYCHPMYRRGIVGFCACQRIYEA